MEINKQTAKMIYEGSPDWFKSQLEKEFGKGNFIKNEFENIKTFEDACNALGVNPDEVYNEKDLPDEIAYKKLKVIVKAINKSWVPDWNNGDERKWWPWFNLSSGFGFSGSNYDYASTYTTVGSRLCFKTEEQSDFAAMQFIDLYEQLLTIK